MEYRSKVAALACFAVVAVGMSGCSSSTKPSDAPAAGTQAVVTQEGTPGSADESCPIPLAVKQPLTLDQNKAKEVLGFSGTALDLGWYLTNIGVEVVDGGGFYGDSAKSSAKTVEVSKLTAALGDRVKAIQKGTSSMKARIVEGSVIFGDDLPCDSGTYSLHMNEEESGGVTDGVDHDGYTQKLELSFNECVVNEESFLGQDFVGIIIGNSPLAHVMEGRELSETLYTFNGLASVEFNENYTNQGNSWNDREPRDYGNSNQNTGKGEVRLITNALSIDIVDGEEHGNYSSDEDIFISIDSSHAYESTTEYEDESNEGNRTATDTNTDTIAWSVVADIAENSNWTGDANASYSLTALCFSASGEATATYSELDHFIDHGDDDVEQNINNNILDIGSNANSAGYLSLLITENGETALFADAYADMLNASYVRKRIEKEENGINTDSDTAEVTLDGTVGSTLLGGSVVLDTQAPWKMSSAFETDRSEVDEGPSGGVRYENPLYLVEDTPYAGKTVLTGTNTATVEFKFDETEEGNVTYGTITVDDQEPVEYNSIEEMVSDNFEI